MFCSHCGNKNQETAKFCVACGTALYESGSPDVLREGVSAAPPPEAGPPDWGWIGEGFSLLFRRGELFLGALLATLPGVALCCLTAGLLRSFIEAEGTSFDLSARPESLEEMLNFFQGLTARQASLLPLHLLQIVPNALYVSLVGPSYMRLVRAARRGESASAADVFRLHPASTGSFFLAYLLVSVLQTLGSRACCLPGLVLTALFLFPLPAIAIDGMGLRQALKLNFRILSSDWFGFLLFGSALTLIYYSGLLLCCVGILVTAPAAVCALTIAYEERKGAAAESLSA